MSELWRWTEHLLLAGTRSPQSVGDDDDFGDLVHEDDRCQAEHAGDRPVSYTHLTLPTIYSV